jgi:hypothetical protein
VTCISSQNRFPIPCRCRQAPHLNTQADNSLTIFGRKGVPNVISRGHPLIRHHNDAPERKVALNVSKHWDQGLLIQHIPGIEAVSNRNPAGVHK